jgi:hypothetical protein
VCEKEEERRKGRQLNRSVRRSDLVCVEKKKRKGKT